MESEVTQLCPTLCNPMDCNLPGSSIHVIFQARILEWVAISFSRRSSQPRDWTRVSHIVGRCFTLWATREVLSGTIDAHKKLADRPWPHHPHSCSLTQLNDVMAGEPHDVWSVRFVAETECSYHFLTKEYSGIGLLHSMLLLLLSRFSHVRLCVTP